LTLFDNPGGSRSNQDHSIGSAVFNFAAIIQSLSTDLQAAYDLLPTTASVADSSESGAIVLPTANVQFA